ncbi:MAG: hypothetical protein M1444_04315 [Patescibacteria group bacterium]|nr:hypothetical protein [Patescibacteria group bacterium]
MKKTGVYVIFLLIILFSFSFGRNITYSQTDSPSPSPSPSPSSTADLQALQNKINDLQNKIADLKGQEKTLSSQIAVMDNQIKLTEYRIEATQEQITSLILDIDTATKKISGLQEALNNLVEVLANRIVATYEVGTIQPFQILLTSNNAADFFKRLNYLKIAQEHDKKLVYDTQQAKVDYANQKVIFEDKKKQVEALKKQLEDYTAQLDQDKKDKQVLLDITQNNEVIYQQKLQAALAEQRAIQQITSGGGNAAEVGPVNEGDVVGYMISGKSACSSGTHLHFEVSSNGVIQDPSGYLANKSVIWDNSPDGSFSFTGSWNFPVSDPIRIEQGYGMTYWARTGWYRGGPHTGIDMFSDSSYAVRAVKPGKLFRGGIACGGGQLLFARVDQDNGIQTYYLHIVP